MKRLLNALLAKTVMNWRHPFYSLTLFNLSARYVDFCYGDNNFDRNTNGEYRLLRILGPQMKVVFDVGANTGEYASVIQKNNNQAVIHCFEPDPRAFESLKLNKGLTANNFALGDKSGQRHLNLSKKSEHNSFLTNETNSIGSANVMVSTLDEYCRARSITHIDLLKIDVEGWEYHVLQGGKELFGNNGVDYVQFEFSGASREARVFLKDFMDFFGSNGYDLYRIKPLCIEKVTYSPAKERFTLTNYLAIKRTMPLPKELHAKNTDF